MYFSYGPVVLDHCRPDPHLQLSCPCKVAILRACTGCTQQITVMVYAAAVKTSDFTHQDMIVDVYNHLYLLCKLHLQRKELTHNTGSSSVDCDGYSGKAAWEGAEICSIALAVRTLSGSDWIVKPVDDVWAACPSHAKATSPSY